jgi:signal peptidase II
MATTSDTSRTCSGRRRAVLASTAFVLLVVDLCVKASARAALADHPVMLGPLTLRLIYNQGVGFGLGTAAPPWLVLGLTAALTIAIAVAAWRRTAATSAVTCLSLALILGGALSNVVDRAWDGLVTDYLNLGWWPVFNLADVFIVTGTLLLVSTTRPQADRR